ncbi:MAG: hypothetical protein K0M55_15940 [Rhizobium sp.]|nr:hypothetical protein [Rhizobium sp.]MBW8322001.1 hypothetical protein [Rhizobium sp.]MBW8447921.1 hypothetical protein [Arenimonas sp.]
MPGFHALDGNRCFLVADDEIRVLGKLAPQRRKLRLLLAIGISRRTASPRQCRHVVIEQADFRLDVAFEFLEVGLSLDLGNAKRKLWPAGIEHGPDRAAILLRHVDHGLVFERLPGRIENVDIALRFVRQIGAARANVAGQPGNIALLRSAIVSPARCREVRTAIDLQRSVGIAINGVLPLGLGIIQRFLLDRLSHRAERVRELLIRVRDLRRRKRRLRPARNRAARLQCGKLHHRSRSEE